MRASTAIAAIAFTTTCIVPAARAEQWVGVNGGPGDFLWLDMDSIRKDEATNLLAVRTNRPDDTKSPGGRDVQGGGPRLRFIDCAGRRYGFSAGRMEEAPATSD